MIDCFIGNARTFLLAASQFFSCVHTKTVSSWYNISYGTITSNKLNIHDSIERLNSEWVSFLFKTTYRCLVCNGVTIFGYGNYWGQMARLGITGGFSVVPIFTSEKILHKCSVPQVNQSPFTQLESAEKNPHKQTKKTCIFFSMKIYEDKLYMQHWTEHQKKMYVLYKQFKMLYANVLFYINILRYHIHIWLFLYFLLYMGYIGAVMSVCWQHFFWITRICITKDLFN